MTWAEMNQYERANAKEKVFGYMVGRHPLETEEEEFERAKRECLQHLRRQIEQIESMAFHDAFARFFQPHI